MLAHWVHASGGPRCLRAGILGAGAAAAATGPLLRRGLAADKPVVEEFIETAAARGEVLMGRGRWQRQGYLAAAGCGHGGTHHAAGFGWGRCQLGAVPTTDFISVPVCRHQAE